MSEADFDFNVAIPFAGGEGTHSILSVLDGAHSIGQGILGFFTMKESNALRSVCKEFREAVMDFPWMDAKSVIKGSLRAWRAAFPAARAVNLSMYSSWDGRGRRKPIVDSDFVHIRGDARARLHTLNMSESKGVTDAAFVDLRGIQTLNMRWCNQATITDAAFVHLRGIQTLDMSYCSQATITDAAFVHMRGIQTLNMSLCTQITDAAFSHLRGIQTLNMNSCWRITDAAFVHLRGIKSLNMSWCNQATITDAAFAHLRGIQTLDMSWCHQATITGAALMHLRGLHVIK